VRGFFFLLFSLLIKEREGREGFPRVAQGKLYRCCLAPAASACRVRALLHTCTRAKTLETLAPNPQRDRIAREFLLRGFFKTVADFRKTLEPSDADWQHIIVSCEGLRPALLVEGGRGKADRMKRASDPCQATR
jgi:hypothetical protein